MPARVSFLPSAARRRFPTIEPGAIDWLRSAHGPSIAGMNSSPKFLVLFDGATRALLFDRDQKLVGEVIEDDGFIVEGLLRSASECPCPDDTMLHAVVPPPSPADRMRCYELH